MPTAAKEYVSARALGDFAACRTMMDEVAVALRGLNPEGGRRRASFAARVLTSAESIEDEMLDERKVLAATDNVLPCLWVNITFDPDRLSLQEIDGIAARFELRLIGTAESKVNYF